MTMSFESVVRRLEQACMAVAALCVTAMMLVVCWDAGGRYLFHRPLAWSFDLISNYLLIIAAWFAISGTFQRGDHIRIDLFHAKFGRRGRAAADILTAVLAFALFAGIGWASAVHAYEAWVSKDFYPGAFMWPAWLSFAPIPIGAAVLLLRLLHHIVTLVRLGEDPYVSTDAEEGAE
jgi:TRAP-type C4-dicarboxylate transport system permease small subunit